MKKTISLILSAIMLISACISVPVLSFADDCEHTSLRIELRYDSNAKKYYAIEVCASCGIEGESGEVSFEKTGDSLKITIHSVPPQEQTIPIYALSGFVSQLSISDSVYNQFSEDFDIPVKQLKCKHPNDKQKAVIDYDTAEEKYIEKFICSDCGVTIEKVEMEIEKSGDNLVISATYNGDTQSQSIGVAEFLMSISQSPIQITDSAKSQLAKLLGVSEKVFTCKHKNAEETVRIKNGKLYGYVSCKDCGLDVSIGEIGTIKKDGNKYVIETKRSDGGTDVKNYTKDELIYLIVSTKELSDESRKNFAEYLGVSASSLAYNPNAKKPGTLKKKSLSSATITGISDKTYTGKKIKQSKIKVVVNNKKLKLNKDYKIVYKKNKAVGKATVKIVGIGNYRDTVKKTFKILPVGVAVKILVKYKKGKNINGYQVQYSTNKKFKKAKSVKVKNKKTVKAKIKNPKAGKTYYVRVRTYKKVGKAYYYSKWSKAKTVKVK